MVEAVARRACASARSRSGEACAPQLDLRRGADQPAARLQGDRRLARRRTRSSSATAATSSPPRRRSCASTQLGALARSGPARHARRRARATRWRRSSRRRRRDVVIIYGDGSFGLHVMEFEAMRPPEDQHRRRDRQRRGVDADPPRPGADCTARSAPVATGLALHPLRARWSRRSAATASTSSDRGRSGPRSSARSAPASRRW